VKYRKEGYQREEWRKEFGRKRESNERVYNTIARHEAANNCNVMQSLISEF